MQIQALDSGYIPGVCNIGKEERRGRTISGLVSLVITLGLAVWLLLAHAAWPWRLFTLLPAMGMFVGFYQAAFHFCVNFGLRGVFNFGVKVGETTSVAEVEAHKKDLAKVRFLLLISFLSGAVVTLAVIFIP